MSDQETPEIQTDPEANKDGETEHDIGFWPKLNDISQKFIADSVKEKKRLGKDFPICAMLINEAIDRVYSTGRVPGRECHADIYKQKPMKLTQKVSVPVKEYPKFNFTGKILGPKGNSLRRVQNETKCRIALKGRNSIRNREKEEELRKSGDPRHSHLNKDLFLEISVVAPPAESYARIAYALAEIRKYLVPDKNDDVSQQQLRELMSDPSIDNEHSRKIAKKAYIYKSILDIKGISKSTNNVTKSSESRQDYYRHYEYEKSSEDEPEDDEQYERVVRREEGSPSYNYVRVPQSRTVAPTRVFHKRTAPLPDYSSEVKRTREMHIYKHSPYHYSKKY